MYKILLPVSAPAFLAQARFEELKDHAKNLIVVHNGVDPMVKWQTRLFAYSGAEVYHFPRNLGNPASKNFGMRKMMDDKNCEFIILLSASAILKNHLPRMVRAIREHEQKEPMCQYIMNKKMPWHCFAVTRKGVEVGGYFDENFWPNYLEDTDMIWRQQHNGMTTKVLDEITPLIKSAGVSVSLMNPNLKRMVEMTGPRRHNYYERKWGGPPHKEVYTNPFNNPNMGINDWIREV